jgi:hypothetical protein
MVMEAVADLVESATLVALTVALVLTLTVGAVYCPDVETVPALADQFTAVLVVPVTVSANCCVPPDGTVAEVGEMETETVLPPVLAKPVMARRSAAVVS